MNARQVIDGNNNDGFLCGVVEGFYGPPWSCDQRKDLFKRLKGLKLDTFMYAPKDDTKHRAKWRQLYSEHEARQLKILIDEAKAYGIDFYYSLAPGLDMVYSDQEELNLLVRKYDQLVSLGCEHFAILFDDIEPIINEKDRNVFKNYASAQVSVTNMIFEHLKQPKFLFCPTEYCESRAVPTVSQSIYLNTIGTGLHKGIDIMWSGSRVISRLITEEQIDRLTEVIRRRPVIWENLHANDYDMKRVFLGPYSGRSTKIIPKLKGVLTNPNCEYEANYIAIHTLAQWSKCTEDMSLHNRCNPDTRYHDMDRSIWASFEQISDSIYDPHRALAYAIKDWLPRWLEARSLPSGVDLSQQQTQPRSDELASDQLAKQQDNNNKVIDVEESNVDMIPDETRSSANSVCTSKSDMDTSSPPSGAATNLIENTNSCDSCEMQETQTTTNKNSNYSIAPPPLLAQDQQTSSGMDCGVTGSNNKADSNTVLALNSATDAAAIAQLASDKIVNFEDLSLLVDLFYLPFEHGSLGYALLNDIKWLKDNHDILLSAPQPQPPESRQQQQDGGNGDNKQQDTKMDPCGEATTTPAAPQDMQLKTLTNWMDRAEKLANLCACIDRLGLTLLSECPNKLLSAELYPYLNDLMFASINIKEYIKFLRYRTSTRDHFYLNVSCKYKEPVSSDEQEPWIHRGGLIGDVYRLLS